MQWVIVGQFGKAHGLKGLVRVHSFTLPEDNLLRYPDWYMKTSEGWMKIKVERMQLQGRSILAKVTDIDDRDQVAQLTNRQIAVPEDSLPALEAGEHYWFHLIGLQVVNLQGVVLGKVEDLMATGSNDVLVVKGVKEFLIPYLPDQFVFDIDQDNKRIVVDWDENF